MEQAEHRALEELETKGRVGRHTRALARQEARTMIARGQDFTGENYGTAIRRKAARQTWRNCWPMPPAWQRPERA